MAFIYRIWNTSFILAGLIILASGCIFAPRSDLQSIESKAAHQNPEAEYKLAKHYEHGDGVPKNLEMAAKYLRQSAEQGYVYAETDLGSYYARGLGVQQDFSKALCWYQKAANSRDTLAEYCIGYAYANGDGVQKDFPRAIYWWQKSAESGQADAQNALGQFYFQGETPDDTNHVNYAKSAKWLGKAAGQNYVPAMNNLAFLYQNGWGVKKNLHKAFHWYQVAADKGDAMAQANLGLMYQDGSGTAPDMVQAYKWFTLSAEQGNIVGKHSFDDYNEHHRLTPEQFAEAGRMVAQFHAQTRTKQPDKAPK